VHAYLACVVAYHSKKAESSGAHLLAGGRARLSGE